MNKIDKLLIYTNDMFIMNTYVGICCFFVFLLLLRVISYINNRFFKYKKLQRYLEEENAYIISNNFSSCYYTRIFGFRVLVKCSLSRCSRVINFENSNDIYRLIKNLSDDVKFIIQTEGGDTEEANYLAYILKQKKIKITSYIPNYALSAGSFIAITGETIYMNWYSTMGPIDTQVDFSTKEDDSEDETFPAKYVAKVKKKDNAMVKLKAREAQCYHYDDKFIINSMFKGKEKSEKIIKNLLETKHSHNMRFGPKHLRSFGLNINTNMPDKIQEIFDIFMKQYNCEF